jgi:hypothetical protein
MEIIKKGTLPSERVYEAKCNHCSTEVRFKRGEAKCETHRNEEYVMVECPVCKHTISVDGGAYIKQGKNQ